MAAVRDAMSRSSDEHCASRLDISRWALAREASRDEAWARRDAASVLKSWARPAL